VASPPSVSGIASRYASVTGARPQFLLQSTSGLCAAKWRLPRFRVLSPWAPHHVLVYWVRGVTPVTRSCCGISQRKVPAIGSVTFSSGDRPTEWTSDAAVEAIHVYIEAGAVERFAAQHPGYDGAPRIHDFFGIADPWLDAYFRLLDRECAVEDAGAESDPHRPAASPFLDHTAPLLLRHLLRFHSAAAHATARRRGAPRIAPLSGVVLRRIEELIDADPAADVSLRALAHQAHLSVDHFVRAFRAAAGTTPHRFVMERRLGRGAAMLEAGGAAVSDIAHACGFRSAAHFSVRFRARFGVTPSQHRRSSS